MPLGDVVIFERNVSCWREGVLYLVSQIFANTPYIVGTLCNFHKVQREFLAVDSLHFVTLSLEWAQDIVYDGVQSAKIDPARDIA